MKSPKLLKSDTLHCVKQLLAKRAKAILAVSYWGEGAIKSLGLDEFPKNDRKTITIVCDLMSGACNPNVIEELKDKGYAVKKYASLHAKVYRTREAVVIGSSNASANGLGFEGKELEGNIEANALIMDPSFVNACGDWLVRTVVSGSSEITDSQLKEAKKRWQLHRGRRAVNDTSLSQIIATNAEGLKERPWFASVIFDNQFSKEGDRVDKEAKQQYSKKMSGYELTEKKTHSGEWVIDYYWGKHNLSYGGIWKMADIKPKKTTSELYFHYAEEKNSLDGVKLDVEAKKIIKRKLQSLLPPSPRDRESIDRSLYELITGLRD